jgi:hypothetical protein
VREAIVVHPVEELGEVLAIALRGGKYSEGRLTFPSDRLGSSELAPH